MAATTEGDSAQQWPEQAKLLDAALEAMTPDRSDTPPEPRVPGRPGDGSFTARILAVDPDASTATIDRIQSFVDEEARRAAAEDGRQVDASGLYVRNRFGERTVLPLSRYAVFTRYYPSATEPNVVSVRVCEDIYTGSMTAMDVTEFARAYAADDSLRDSLGYSGAWVVVKNGEVALVRALWAP
jgi:hypothetical protein